MMKKTVEASRATAKSFGIPKPLILAVTILTSMDEGALKEVGVQGSILEEVGRLASLASKAGIDGVIASPQEIGTIRERCGEKFLIVTPGIRAPSDKKMTKREPSPRRRQSPQGRTISSSADPSKKRKTPSKPFKKSSRISHKPKF